MVTELSIKNFKCLDYVKGVKLKKVNLLTGVNGKGKSSFLQVLIMLSQTWRSNNYQILTANGSLIRLGGYSELINVNSNDKNIEFEIKTDGQEEECFGLTYKKSSSRPEFGELCGFSYNGHEMLADDTMSSNDSADFSDDDNTIPTISTIDSYQSLMALKRLYYVAANRQAPLSGIYNYKSDTTKKMLLPDGTNVISKIMSLSVSDRIKLDKYLDAIFDGATLNITDDGENYRLSLDSNRNTDKLFSPVNVGYGLGYILVLLTSLVMSKEGDIVVVENPEAHLHPGAQARLLEIMIDESLAKDVQIIVETHSDHIVNALQVAIKTRNNFSNNDAEIIFFGDKLMNLNITPKGRIIAPPKSFCDQYTNDLNILFS